MKAEQIKNILKNKYCKPEYIWFEEFRTGTGKGKINYIDFLTISTYPSNFKMIAFEVKVTRQDFMNDVANFKDKQLDVFNNSTEFYYITPFNLVKADEVPEHCGLYYINKGNKLIKKKNAQLRQKKTIPIKWFLNFMRQQVTESIQIQGNLKYLDTVISIEEFNKIVEKEIKTKLPSTSVFHEEQSTKFIEEVFGEYSRIIWTNPLKSKQLIFELKKLLNQDYSNLLTSIKTSLTQIKELQCFLKK